MKAVIKKIDFRFYPARVSCTAALPLAEAQATLAKLRLKRGHGDPVVHGLMKVKEVAA